MFTTADIDQMITERVAKPAYTEWTVLIVSAIKKDDSLRFSVEHRELNAVTNRDSYSLPPWTNASTAWGRGQNFQHWKPARDTGR